MDEFPFVVCVVQVAKVLFVSYDRRQFEVPPIMRCNADSRFSELIAASLSKRSKPFGAISQFL